MNWQEFNSFSPWFAAAGTWFAAWTALRLARRADEPRAVVGAEYGSKYPNVGGRKDIVIRATNVNRRIICVTGVYWEAGAFTWKDYPVMPNRKDNERVRLSTSFPSTLKEGESLAIFIAPETFGYDFVDHRMSVLEGGVATRLLRLKVELIDGATFRAQPSRALRKFLFRKHFGSRVRWSWVYHFV